MQLNNSYKLGDFNIPVVVTETWIHQVQFSINFQALHIHNFQISDTASNKLHTATQSQLTAPAEWYKHSSQLVSSVIITVGSPTVPCQLAYKLEMHDSSKIIRYNCSCVQEQETWGWEKQLHTFLFPALHGGQWSASCHGHFTPMKEASSVLWLRGCVVPRPHLDALEKKIASCHCTTIQWLYIKEAGP